MERIFIDTNKYLDFFRASENSIKTLDNLIDLIEKGKLELILPKQVSDEFIRDKDLIYLTFIKENFKKIKIPAFLKENDEIKNVNKLIDEIEKDYKDKFYDEKSRINISIKKIFKLAKTPKETDKILQLAHFRTLRGNPPRKNNNSFGDAIIWETLLQYSDKDLIIISGDGDWSSELENKTINPFLKAEWFKNKNKSLKLYDNLGQYINENLNREEIPDKLIKEEKELSLSHVSRPVSSVNGIIPGLNTTFLYSDFPSLSINQNTCICCQKSYGFDVSRIDFDHRCPDCKDGSLIVTIPEICHQCGNHYHRSLTDISLYPNFCSNCKSKFI